jgi:hypothetical protein
MPACVYSETEKKLLRLALCPNAALGEIETAGRALIGSLRKRGVRAEQLFSTLVPTSAELKTSRPETFAAKDFIMPFGKYRYLPLSRVTTDYLNWAVANYRDLQPELKRAMKAVLAARKGRYERRN